MGAQKPVKLPQHLWSALDDMSRDGQQSADVLMELAVEQFVALQGYELPIAERPAAEPAPARPSSLQDDDDDLGLARTMARSALVPEQKEDPGATNMAPPHKPAAKPPEITGLAPTHVPSKKTGGLKAIEPAPAVTDMGPAHKPAPAPAPPPPAPAPVLSSSGSNPAAKGKAAPSKPAPEPAWVKRPVLSDADEERAAARERMVAIDADVAKLTIERPTTRPLGQSVDEGE